MTPEEIRKCEATSQEARFLREIAAQLADLNELFRKAAELEEKGN